MALMLGTLSLSATSCSNNETKMVKNTSDSAIAETVEQSTKINEVVFKKGKLIEVAFLSVKEGMSKQLKEDYFPKVMPIVAEYGGKPLMKIGVKNNYSEDIKAQMIVFFEWPNAAQKEAFEKDPRFLKVKTIRDEALSFLQLSFFEVAKNMPVKLEENKFYEVYGMSMNKENGHLMQKYFEKAAPLCMNEYNVDFALTMSPVKVNISGHEHYVPQTFGLAILPSEGANVKYFGSKEYAEIKHYKEDALEQMDAWQGAVILK